MNDLSFESFGSVKFGFTVLLYHPVAQDWLPTEIKQGCAWLVPGKTRLQE